MTVQTLKVGATKYVVIAKRDYERLQAQAELKDRRNAADVAESKRRKSRRVSRPYAELRRKLGLKMI